jgi:hypothetical protein
MSHAIGERAGGCLAVKQRRRRRKSAITRVIRSVGLLGIYDKPCHFDEG